MGARILHLVRTSDAHGGHSARPSLSLHVCPKLPCGPMNWLGPTLFMSVVGYPSPLPFSFPLEVPRIETLVKLSSRLQGARELLSLSLSLSLCLSSFSLPRSLALSISLALALALALSLSLSFLLFFFLSHTRTQTRSTRGQTIFPSCHTLSLFQVHSPRGHWRRHH